MLAFGDGVAAEEIDGAVFGSGGEPGAGIFGDAGLRPLFEGGDEGFLGEVPLLATLLPYERSKIADALEEVKFKAGATIIREGEPGEDFFILESSTAEVYKEDEDGCVMTYKKGDYFGELALLNDQ